VQKIVTTSNNITSFSIFALSFNAAAALGARHENYEKQEFLPRINLPRSDSRSTGTWNWILDLPSQGEIG